MLNGIKQHLRETNIGIYTGTIPSVVTHHLYCPSTFEADGMLFKSCCISCASPICTRFSTDDLKLTNDKLKAFPVLANDYVCPVDAINRNNGLPSIDENRCVNCGICARRCPIGAIYSNGKNAVIHTGESYIQFFPLNPETGSKQEDMIKKLRTIRHEGIYQEINRRTLSNIYSQLHELPRLNSGFPNLVTRNFFLVLGTGCAIRRRGDVYIRMDAIIADKTGIGVAEIEFRNDTLESPRAILDDIAVLASRYGIEKERIKPFIISLEFPDNRSEYWRVIKDIRDVLGIKIQSLTLGALCILAWTFASFFIGQVDFYADADSPSIKDEIQKIIGGGKIPDRLSAAVLEPFK